MHDGASFQLTHVSKYPAPILSLAVSPDCSKLAVGMANGVLSIRQRRPQSAGPSLRLPGAQGQRTR